MTNGLGLGNAYGATLDRIKGRGEKSRLGMAAPMWISHAERPLKPDGLNWQSEYSNYSRVKEVYQQYYVDNSAYE